jgi:[acyl-carrier-protein] S-malonyltransferase
MGKAIADASLAARDVYARADAALGEPLSTLCFEGPLEALTLTANTQPALVATSLALLAALRERVPELPPPAFAAGHSLGEYSALAAASALSLEDAVCLCRLRGAAMQDAVPAGEGAMAAVMGLDAAALAAICDEASQGERVVPANYNGPGQTVIAGHAGAVERAIALVIERKGKAIPLKVSAPFHSPLMRPAALRLAPALDAVAVKSLDFPVIANVDAEPSTDSARVRDLLVRQVDAPVRWLETVQRLAREGVTHALEIGPGKVLTGLVKRIDKSIRVIGVGDVEGIDAVRALVRGTEV